MQPALVDWISTVYTECVNCFRSGQQCSLHGLHARRLLRIARPEPAHCPLWRWLVLHRGSHQSHPHSPWGRKVPGRCVTLCVLNFSLALQPASLIPSLCTFGLGGGGGGAEYSVNNAWVLFQFHFLFDFESMTGCLLFELAVCVSISSLVPYFVNCGTSSVQMWPQSKVYVFQSL